MDTDDVKRQFERQVEKHQALNNLPHIIRLLGSGWAHGKPFLVMPYISGRSLGDALKKEKWPSFGEGLTYIQQTAEALSYAHEKGIIHRDVKPANLLLDSSGVLLSDFGLAIDVAAPTPPTRNWGSDYYCPPEQEKGNPVLASDQYALAVTMCKLFTQQYPKKNEPKNEKEHGKEKLQEDFPNIAKVFMRAWDDKPNNRYKSINEFADELKKAARSDFPDLAAQATIPAPLAPPASPRRPPTPWSRRVIAALAILLLLPVLFGVWMVRGVTDGQQDLLIPFSPTCPTVTTLQDDGSLGSLRKALNDIPQGQTCLLSFASSLHGTLILAGTLKIDRNVIIEAPYQRGQPSKNQVTVAFEKPEVAIAIGVGYTVSFQNISFQGLGQSQPPLPTIGRARFTLLLTVSRWMRFVSIAIRRPSVC
jgi:serine/threonine protein kinase